ncbi:putative PurR-regulated permease PerM [Glaciihabitans tibetensis]|uniref:Putative PurR-regulated permease PerM n=1 Tax=Glaciihabitans tibetensis TaxID=1266600 RepID=A0A2T0VIW1_9MICO|nr:AI-2E family transporter [Glaciihabitans tibetensis]PRY70154.1 putative PurR-regulated permease PerM [Glaciihabitans tibetensis]
MADTQYPRGTVILVGLAAAVVVAIGISELRGILAPVLLTLVLTICAGPVRTGLEKHGVPRGIATGSVILVVFGLLAVFTYTIIIAFAQFVAMLPDYADQFQEIAASITTALALIGIDQTQVESLAGGLNPASIAAAVTGALGSLASITGGLVIVLTMMILMAADAVYVRTILRQLEVTRPHLVAALGAYASNVRRYMVVTTVLGVVQGALNAIALVILEVPAALLWGLLAFLCSFIPNIGYFFAIAPPIVFGYLTGGWPVVVAVVVVYTIINAVVQSIIQPRVVGQAVSLSQTLTFFSVLFWALVIGPIGAILAVPLTLLAKAVLVDSNPDAHAWRPAIGPTAETRSILKADYAASKEQRHATKADSRAAAKRARIPQ